MLDEAVLERAARRLGEEGLVEPVFFDRAHECDRCGASRFNVREECAACASPNLREEPYVHHFRCAHQGPESDFRNGDDLVCPKCRRRLGHFGVEYDKPGSVLKCLSCGHAASEPRVGFVCLDCAARIDGNAVRSRDIHGYALTDRGAAFIELGHAFLGHAERALRGQAYDFALMKAIEPGKAREVLEGARDQAAATLRLDLGIAMRAAGGYTIAQDEASSAVYGMPKVAFLAGGALDQLPLSAIPRRLLALTAPSPSPDLAPRDLAN